MAFTLLLLGTTIGTAVAYETDTLDSEWRPALLLSEVQECVETHFCLPDRLGPEWQSEINRIRIGIDSYKSKDALVRDLNTALGLLNMSHTKLLSLDDPESYELLGVFSATDQLALENSNWIKQNGGRDLGYAGIGLRCESHGDLWLVRGVLPGSPAEQSGILVGDAILKCDEGEFHPIRSFRDKLNGRVRLNILTPNEPHRDIDVEVVWYDVRKMFLDAIEASARVIEVQGKKIGYIRVWSYAGEQYQKLVEKILLDGNLSDCEGLILDLRGGWGGATPHYLSLFDATIPVIQYTQKNQEKTTYYPTWNKPVALLIDDTVRSGKEILVHGFKKWKRGEVIGSRTAGAVCGGRAFKLSQGMQLYLAVVTCEVDGRNLEGVGVDPTIEVSFDWKASKGSDPVIEKAIESVRLEIP